MSSSTGPGNTPPNFGMFNRDFHAREFPMSDEDFEFLRRLAREKTGIELSDHKKEMIYSRVVRRIRTLKLANFRDYCLYLQRNAEAEMTDFINAITTNLTSFFREAHHFDYLRDTVLPSLRGASGRPRSLRIWSAGCSTGEEPYSIAMTLCEAGVGRDWDVKILATDLDSNVIAHGKAGVYNADKLDGVPLALRSKYFSAQTDGSFRVRPELAALITFQQLNLLHQWPVPYLFDAIFCRNVVIYFSKDTQRLLFDRFANQMTPTGWLFIGHSESLHGVSTRFQSIGRTIYRRSE